MDRHREVLDSCIHQVVGRCQVVGPCQVEGPCQAVDRCRGRRDLHRLPSRRLADRQVKPKSFRQKICRIAPSCRPRDDEDCVGCFRCAVGPEISMGATEF